MPTLTAAANETAAPRVDLLRTIDGDVILSAWERSTIMGPHSTIHHFGEACYGRVGTRRLPAALDALKPRSEERYTAVRAFLMAEYDRAYAAIEAAYPAAIGAGERSMGEIRFFADALPEAFDYL